MDRIIKFRAWCHDQQRMFNVYGMGLDFITEDTLDGIDPGVNCFSGEDFKKLIPMQYTNYADKFKNPIYEADIVKDRFGRIMQVCFYNGRLLWRCDDPKNNFKYADLYQWIDKGRGMAKNERILTLEVIGNIYQNPELL